MYPVFVLWQDSWCQYAAAREEIKGLLSRKHMTRIMSRDLDWNREDKEQLLVLVHPIDQEVESLCIRVEELEDPKIMQWSRGCVKLVLPVFVPKAGIDEKWRNEVGNRLGSCRNILQAFCRTKSLQEKSKLLDRLLRPRWKSARVGNYS